MAVIKTLDTGHSFICRNERVIDHCKKDSKTYVIEDEPKTQKRTKTAAKTAD